MKKIKVLGKEISLLSKDKDYICLTDMVKFSKSTTGLINKWVRNKNTLEFLAVWEKIHNEDFNYTEFGIIRNESGTNRFLLSIKEWINKTNSIGIKAKSGRYGGTYAHIDIALEFASWISPEFKLYLIEEFRRLKEKENKNNWNVKRILTKINYNIHTNAIKENLIPLEISQEQKNKIYASEAEVLNVALFGITSKEWKENNKGKEGNLREYANVNQLVCLSNLESLNSVLINESLSQKERLVKLNQVAINQMRVLVGDKSVKKLK